MILGLIIAHKQLFCSAGKDERDLIILRHTLGIAWPDNKKETRGINLVVYGDAKCSAMAKTVGYPAAIAAKMILDGKRPKWSFE